MKGDITHHTVMSHLTGPDFLGRKERTLRILDQDIDYASRADVSKIRELKDFL